MLVFFTAKEEKNFTPNRIVATLTLDSIFVFNLGSKIRRNGERTTEMPVYRLTPVRIAIHLQDSYE